MNNIGYCYKNGCTYNWLGPGPCPRCDSIHPPTTGIGGGAQPKITQPMPWRLEIASRILVGICSRTEKEREIFDNADAAAREALKISDALIKAHERD